MPNHQDESTFVSDQISLNQPYAKNREERRRALEFCLTYWGKADIGRLERIDTDELSGWRMWRYKSDPA